VKVAYQGELKRRLSGTEFFEVVGRSDLAEQYTRRRHYAYGGVIGGTVATIAGGAMLLRGLLSYSRDLCIDNNPSVEAACEAREDQNEREYQDGQGFYKIGGGMLLAGGFVGMLVGAYYAYNPSPVESKELYDLAAKHNLDLRKKYGLPVSNVGVSPYVDQAGGGMVVSGRF
jgi:cobalamin biosynthesis Mg chelatase CobN